MKAKKILEVLSLYEAVNRGVNVYPGAVLQTSFDTHTDKLVCGEVNFEENASYVEIRKSGVSADLWNRIEVNDGFAIYEFAEYRYLKIE